MSEPIDETPEEEVKPTPTTRYDRLRLRKPISEPEDPEDVNVEGGKWRPFY